MRLLAIALMAVTLAGCAQNKTVWDKPGATPAMFEQDKNQCIYEARSRTPAYYGGSLAGMVDEASRNVELQVLCMKARGYTPRIVEAKAETDPEKK